eukprot:COSAG02_NODE_287_length_25647_cov_245.259316_9_plen_102_part_00
MKKKKKKKAKKKRPSKVTVSTPTQLGLDSTAGDGSGHAVHHAPALLSGHSSHTVPTPIHNGRSANVHGDLDGASKHNACSQYAQGDAQGDAGSSRPAWVGQ